MNKITEQYKQYMGQNLNASVEKTLRLSNPVLRVIKVGYTYTQEIRPDRLNVMVDAMNQITGFSKG